MMQLHLLSFFNFKTSFFAEAHQKPLGLFLQGTSYLQTQSRASFASKVLVLVFYTVLVLWVAKMPAPSQEMSLPITVSLLKYESPAVAEKPLIKEDTSSVKSPVQKQLLPKPVKVIEPVINATASDFKISSPPTQELTQLNRIQSEEKAPATEQVSPATTQGDQQVSAEAAPAVQAIEPPKFGVAYLNNPEPEYPLMSRRAKEKGKVLLKVLVNERGLPDSVQVSSSSGFERLDQAAVEAVKQWRFIPAQQNNQALSAWVNVPINFSLKN